MIHQIEPPSPLEKQVSGENRPEETKRALSLLQAHKLSNSTATPQFPIRNKIYSKPIVKKDSNSILVASWFTPRKKMLSKNQETGPRSYLFESTQSHWPI